MQEGWILLHRKIQECEIWSNSQPFDMRSAWVDLLLLANHKDVEIVFDYKPMVVRRGQYLTSVRKLSARWSWSKDRTLKYLRLLESLGMIHRDSTNQRTLITIEKYDVYQNEQDTGTDAKRTQPRTQVGRKTDTGTDTGSPQTKNEKNEKNDKKNIYGEYKHVRLTQKQYDKLVDDYGEELLKAAIKYLDEYMQMKGRKYSDHNLVLRKWVFDAVKGKGLNNGSGTSKVPRTDEEQRNAEIDEQIRRINAGEIPDERPFAMS